MALYRYFQASEKSSCKLSDPRGPLSRLVPSSSIASANEKVQSVLESKGCTWRGRKGQRYSKRTEGRNRQAGSRARRGCYSQVIRYDCWAMGVVKLQLEVGRESTAWRSSKIKSRKV